MQGFLLFWCFEKWYTLLSIYKTDILFKLSKLMSIFSILYLVPLFSVFCGVLCFVRSRKHLLNTLLSLEYVILRIFWFMRIMMVNLGGERVFLLFFLTLAACEGALGLGLLVRVVRSHGRDSFRRFRVLQC